MNKVLASAALALVVASPARAQAPDYGQLLEAVNSATSARDLFYAVNDAGPNRLLLLDSLRLAGLWHRNCFRYQLVGGTDPCVRYPIEEPPLWQHADFDQDGRPDLLGVDRFGRAWGLLNRGPALPQLASLNYRSPQGRGCHHYQLIRLGRQPAVVHFYVAPRGDADRSMQREPEIWQDTLVYHAGAFVEYNPHPGTQWPTQIDLAFSEGKYPVYKFSVAADLRTGQVTGRYDRDDHYHSEEGYVGPLSFQLEPDQLARLRQQSAYLNPARLRPLYDTGYAPADTAWVALYYPGRPAVRVADYGTFDTYSLGQLYEVLTEACEQAQADLVAERRRRGKQTSPRPAGPPEKP